MNDLLREYYDLMIARITAMGGSTPGAGRAARNEFWDEIDASLPPEGRLLIARDPSGRLVGCGSLKTIGPGLGEMKRLFVRPEARGAGLGHRLVDMRIQAARQMGLKTLLVDTLKNNVEMRGLYAKIGFEEVDSFPESSTFRLVPGLEPYMCCFRMDLA